MTSWYKAFNAEVEVSSLESFLRHLSRSTNVALLGRAYLALPESFVASLAHPLPSSLFKLTNSSNVFFFFWARMGIIQITHTFSWAWVEK